jgi:hypothetical protein
MQFNLWFHKLNPSIQKTSKIVYSELSNLNYSKLNICIEITWTGFKEDIEIIVNAITVVS